MQPQEGAEYKAEQMLTHKKIRGHPTSAQELFHTTLRGAALLSQISESKHIIVMCSKHFHNAEKYDKG